MLIWSQFQYDSYVSCTVGQFALNFPVSIVLKLYKGILPCIDCDEILFCHSISLGSRVVMTVKIL